MLSSPGFAWSNEPIKRAIQGNNGVDFDFASSLYYLALIYDGQQNYDEEAEFYEQSLEMERAVHAA